MAKPIQAGSLASLIDLAETPPDQPLHNLTADLQQPLVLYIARIPGTLDVFLTTMKPQAKVVTAQDVQSSLYYMHVDRLEDYELLCSSDGFDDLLDVEGGNGKPATLTSSGGVWRKPLPQSPRPGLDARLGPPPEVNPCFQTSSNSAAAGSSQDTMAEHRRVNVSPPLPDRKLLGPRPLNQRFLSLENSPLQDVPEKQKIDLRRWSEQPAGTPPKLPPRPFSGVKYSVPMTPPRPLAASLKGSFVTNGDHSKNLHRKPVAHSASRDWSNGDVKDGSKAKDLQNVSLSLIRRYNSEQWTVGKISNSGRKPTVGGFGESSHEISIHIMTHGYSRFVDAIDPVAEQERIVTENSGGARDNHTPITAAEKQSCFQRHLQVSRHVNTRNQSPGHDFTDSNTTTTPFIRQGTRPSLDHPRHSHQNSDSIEPNRSFRNGLPDLKSGFQKGYILRSPWNGICEFRTGVAGRSFKCKHSYASSNSRFGPGMHSAQVSELRFNLPSSKTFGFPASKSLDPGTTREAKRSSLFLHQHRRRSSSSFEAKDTHGTGYFAPKVELEERLDLSLGQEHAGGGFGGKQAKLGKLIIENEGLQMLDLIVAANMALWWRVYERVT